MIDPSIIVAIIALGGTVVSPIVINRLNHKDGLEEKLEAREAARDKNVETLMAVVEVVKDIDKKVDDNTEKLKELSENQEALGRSQAKQIQNTLLRDMKRYEVQGYVNVDEEDNFIELYDSYVNDLHANGLVKKKYHIVEKLPRK